MKLILINLLLIGTVTHTSLAQKQDTIRVFDIESFISSYQEISPDTMVYMATQHPATFPEGNMALNRFVKQYIQKHFKSSIQDKVMVLYSIIIEKNGCISGVHILPTNNTDKGLEGHVKEALFASAPWFPALQDGKRLRYKTYFSVQFP